MSSPNLNRSGRPNLKDFEDAIRGIDYAMDWRRNTPDAQTFAFGLATARQVLIDSRAVLQAVSEVGPSQPAYLAKHQELKEYWKAVLFTGISESGRDQVAVQVATMDLKLRELEAKNATLARQLEESNDLNQQASFLLKEGHGLVSAAHIEIDALTKQLSATHK